MTQTLPITSEMLHFIAQIDEAKGQWQALRTLAPDRLLALRHSATVESIGSSTRIEGVELNNSEVERLLANLNQTSFASCDEQEVAGYAKVMERVFESWADLSLSENHLMQLHAELLQFSEKGTRHRGRGGIQDSPESCGRFRPGRQDVGHRVRNEFPFRHSFRGAEVAGLAPGGGVDAGTMAPAATNRRIHRPPPCSASIRTGTADCPGC